MVLVILGSLQFEAAKFETRTMPTPDMKGKEMIYWIRIETQDKRLVTELERFLKGASQYIDLKVPSAFIAVRAELENYKVSDPEQGKKGTDQTKENRAESRHPGQQIEETAKENHLQEDERKHFFEIVLRRTIPSQQSNPAQSPYG
jgi:hypothetical protein